MKAIKASVLSVTLLFAAALATDALANRGGHGGGRGGHGGHGHSSVRVGVAFGGPYWYGGYWPYRPYYYGGYYPYPAYPAYAYPAYPAQAYYPYQGEYSYQAEAPAYVEQGAPAPSAAAPTPGFWYYCNESQAYYPNVRQCAGPWQKVSPQPPS